MSTKNGKRSRRKTEDEIQECFKAPLLKKDDDAATAAKMEPGECKGFEKDAVKTMGNEKRISTKPDDTPKPDGNDGGVKKRTSKSLTEPAQKKHDDVKAKNDDSSPAQKKVEEGVATSTGPHSTKSAPSLKKSGDEQAVKTKSSVSVKKGGDEEGVKAKSSSSSKKSDDEGMKTKNSLSIKKGDEEGTKIKSSLSEEVVKTKSSLIETKSLKKSDEEGVKTRSSPSLKKSDDEGLKTRSSPSLKKSEEEGVKTRSPPSLKKGEEEGVKTRNVKAAEAVEATPVERVRTRNSTELTDDNSSDTIVDESTAIDFEAGTNGFNSMESQEDDVEMEPLVVDSEEADPELQFDENSDGESPVISRCTTRRSQTRNIPTPKTPKSFSTDQNGDDPPDRSTPETGSEGTEDFEKFYSADLNETSDSFTSTKVNVGGDETRRQDFSFSEKDSFLNTAKELTVVETMRRLSSRRSIHPSTSGDYRKNLLKSNTERQNISLPYISSRSSVEKVGTKRKNRSETPDRIKRFKPEPSQPGLFSYITSPLQRIRQRFYAKEVPASTPKLTSYRKADLLEQAEISKIENDLNPQGEKKWCSIM